MPNRKIRVCACIDEIREIKNNMRQFSDNPNLHQALLQKSEVNLHNAASSYYSDATEINFLKSLLKEREATCQEHGDGVEDGGGGNGSGHDQTVAAQQQQPPPLVSATSPVWLPCKQQRKEDQKNSIPIRITGFYAYPNPCHVFILTYLLIILTFCAVILYNTYTYTMQEDHKPTILLQLFKHNFTTPDAAHLSVK